MTYRGLTVALAACWLVACGSNAGSPMLHSADVDKANASQQYADCLDAAASRYTNSDVDAAVASVASQCTREYEAMKTVLSRDLGGSEKQKAERDMDSNRLAEVRDAVLRHRQAAAESPQ